MNNKINSKINRMNNKIWIQQINDLLQLAKIKLTRNFF